MNKKFIYFKTIAQFNSKKGSLSDKSIVFIEDTKQIWTHGVFFDTSWDYVTGTPNTLAGYNITDAASKINSLYYVEGNTTGTAGAWTGSIPEVTSLYAGLTIAYKIGVAGASTTNLNLNGLGNKRVRRNTANLTTHLPVGTVVLLTYDGTYWVWADYHANTTYAAMSVAEGKAGTVSTLRTMRADYLKEIVEHHIANTVPSAHTHDYLPLSGGKLTGDLEIFAGNTDKFIKFAYDTTDAYSWRIGYLGTGAGNENRLAFQSAKTSGASYVDALSFGLDDLVGKFAVTPTVGNTKVSLEGHNHTLKLIAGTSTATTNSTADVANPYIRLFSDNAHQGNIQIVGGTNVGVVAKNGVVTLTATNTTYSTGTLAQLNAGTDTTGRLQTAKLLNDWLNPKLNSKFDKTGGRLTTGTGDVNIELWRGTNASWNILNSGGYLRFQSNYTTVAGAYFDTLKLDYNTGNALFKGDVTAPTFIGALSGNATTATTLATTRAINGTNFNGSAAITTARWGTARNIGVVNSDGTGTAVITSVNGSANVNLKLPATIKASLTGNATTATTATYLTRAGNSITTAPATHGLRFDSHVGSTTAGIFPVSNNSNAVITLNRHTGAYDSQLGFSSDGNIYYRAFTAVALNTTQAWNKIYHTGNFANGTTSQYIRGDGSLATYNSTTYTTGTLAQLNAGTDTTGRLQTARILNGWLSDKFQVVAVLPASPTAGVFYFVKE